MEGSSGSNSVDLSVSGHVCVDDVWPLCSSLNSGVEAFTLPEMSSGQQFRMSTIEGTRDEDALKAIVIDLEHRQGQALFGFVRRLGLNDAQAADAVQDVLLRLWAEMMAGTSIEQPKAWAFRAIYRLAMDQHRLQRRIGGIVERLARSDPTGDDMNRDAGDRIAVWAEVARLPRATAACPLPPLSGGPHV